MAFRLFSEPDYTGTNLDMGMITNSQRVSGRHNCHIMSPISLKSILATAAITR